MLPPLLRILLLLVAHVHMLIFLLNLPPPLPCPPLRPPRPRPPPVCVVGGIPAVMLVGEKFAVCGGVYGAVAPRLRCIFLVPVVVPPMLVGRAMLNLATLMWWPFLLVTVPVALPLCVGTSSPVPCLKYFCSTHLCWRWMRV